MLQKLFIHLTLVLLFAFTQIGVATHEISHIAGSTKHAPTEENSTQKSTAAEQCAQCISYAKVASGLLPALLVAPTHQPELATALSVHTSFQHHTPSPYGARAPPQIIRI